jgi:hypothetical protein
MYIRCSLRYVLRAKYLDITADKTPRDIIICGTEDNQFEDGGSNTKTDIVPLG